MKRTNFYFPKKMLARLATESERSGLPMSEILRRALDEWLKEKEGVKND
jgi:hypothetical protein